MECQHSILLHVWHPTASLLQRQTDTELCPVMLLLSQIPRGLSEERVSD